MIVLGTNEQGHREIIGFGVYPNESAAPWKEFLSSLQNRGLAGVRLITSDAHEGLRKVISQLFPEAPWQRCQFHFAKNIAEKAPRKHQAGLRAELQEMFNSKTIEEARRKRDAIIEESRDIAEAATTCLDEGFESSMTVMILSKHLRRYFRTYNHLERLNRELKRRSKVIGVFANAESLLRLMGSVLLEHHEAIQASRAVFSHEGYRANVQRDIPSRLAQIAAEQKNLLAA